jgi:ABC-type sulfate transport system permease subunit
MEDKIPEPSIQSHEQDKNGFESFAVACGIPMFVGTIFFVFYLAQTGKHFPFLESVLFWGGHVVFTLVVLCLWAVFLTVCFLVRRLRAKDKVTGSSQKTDTV